jgi:hypothetical protein
VDWRSAAERWLARADRPAAAALVAALALGAFVVGRVASLHGDATRFVYAGRPWTDPARAPRGLYVRRTTSYDGQFFYRLALDPADLGETAYGIRFDIGLRRARIAYPAIAWAAAGGGQVAAVPWSLIGVNLAALVCLAFLGAVGAQDDGRHALWGLLIPGFPAFLFTLSRDLSEAVAAAALLAGLLLYRRGRFLLTGLAFSLAVLTRESDLAAVGGVAAVSLAGALAPGAERGRWRTAPAWVLPAAAFVAWEAVVYLAVGSIPVRSDRGNLTAPFTGLAPEVWRWLSDPANAKYASRLALLAVLVGFVAAAAGAAARGRARPQEVAAWLALLALAACLSGFVYHEPADFRTLAELYVLSVLLVLPARSRAFVPLAVATSLLWLGLAGYRAVVA